MTCTPEALIEAAKCFECIPPGMQAAVQTYLLASIAGGSLDPAKLMRDGKCIVGCVPPEMMQDVRTHLLCEIVENLPSPEPPAPECDADAQAFIDAALITDENQQDAICKLVADLKSLPAVGTKYWDREVLIYPIIGGNATSHSFNLKNPAIHKLTYPAGAISHTALGMAGVPATSRYAMTDYVLCGDPGDPTSQNNCRAFWYLESEGTTDARYYFGTASTARFFARTALGAGRPLSFSSMDATTSNPYGLGASVLGAWVIQRQTGVPNQKQSSYRTNGLTNTAVASTGVPARYLSLFAYDNAGGTPAGTPSGITDARLSGFSYGAPFTSNAEWAEYVRIWDEFEMRLGRQHN